MDTFGDRMKVYESKEAQRRFLPLLPICARLDGKAFHTFCSVLRKPYDDRLFMAMAETTKILVRETGARLGYTQSDEISLLWYSNDFCDLGLQK